MSCRESHRFENMVLSQYDNKVVNYICSNPPELPKIVQKTQGKYSSEENSHLDKDNPNYMFDSKMFDSKMFDSKMFDSKILVQECSNKTGSGEEIALASGGEDDFSDIDEEYFSVEAQEKRLQQLGGIFANKPKVKVKVEINEVEINEVKINEVKINEVEVNEEDQTIVFENSVYLPKKTMKNKVLTKEEEDFIDSL
jgi:hypothetical protein